MPIPSKLKNLLPDSALPVIQSALEQSGLPLPDAPQWLKDKIGAMRDKKGKPLSVNRTPYTIAAPISSRSLDDIASLIMACVSRIEHAESECPTAQDYEVAKRAEATALAGHQATCNHTDTRIRQAAKKAYEDAKDNRVHVGGMIWGTISAVNRMQAMIAGEIEAIELREVYKKSA
jgi:hypothetical protein